MLRRSFLTSILRTTALTVAISTGLNKNVLAVARNKIKYSCEFSINKTAYLVTATERIAGELWASYIYINDSSYLNSAMKHGQQQLEWRYNHINRLNNG